MSQALEKLCKWRSIFAGWQLGTRSKEDPASQAVRDHREVTMLLRAEVNALVQILVRRRMTTADEFAAQVDDEAEHLMRAYEAKFPGAHAELDGMHIELKLAQPWMSRFPK